MPRRLALTEEYKLIENAKKDLEAFQTIYDHYFPRIYSYVSFRIGGIQDIEDLVSSIFIKAIERLNKFNWMGDGSFTAWLFRVAHDKVVDFYRTNHKDNQTIPIEDMPEVAFTSSYPVEQIILKEQFALLRQLIISLPIRQQEIITLKFFGGLRNSEIARVLSLDERTISSYLCRGIKNLHCQYLKKVKDTGDEEINERSK